MANRYWVGGTASWDGTAGSKWATTDGGAGGSAIPTSADDVFFTAKPAPTWQASTAYILTNIVSPVTGNNFFYECTTAGTTGITEPTWPTVVGNTVTDGTVVWTCRSATVTIATGNTGAKSINCTGFTRTLTGTAAITVSGSITVVAGMTYTYTGTITIAGTGTLTTGGKTFASVTITGSGITVDMGDALTSSGSLIITQGTFTTNNNNLTFTSTGNTNFYVFGSSTKTINLGSSTITTNGQAGAGPDVVIDGTNTTFNAGTSLFKLNNISVGSTITTTNGTITFYNVEWNGRGGTITGTNVFNDLTFGAIAAAGTYNTAIAANQTVNGTLKVTAPSNPNRRRALVSNVRGTARTITCAATNLTDADFQDITAAGTASPFTGTRLGDQGGNSNITFTSKTVYWNLGGSVNIYDTGWCTLSGGTPSADNYPLPQDTGVFNDNGALGTVFVAGSLGTIDASARTSAGTFNFHIGNDYFYGSLKLGSGITVTGGGVNGQDFRGRGSHTLRCAGKKIPGQINIDCITGTYTLEDAFDNDSSLNARLDLISGTFDAATYNVTIGNFRTFATASKTLNMGSGLWTITGTTGSYSVWDANGAGTGGTNFTFNKGTANFLLSNTSTTARTFAGNGLTYNKLTIGGTTGTSTLTITGANTFSELASTKTVAHTITLGANQTVAAWTIAGTAGNVVTVNSSVAGTTRTLTKSGGGFLTGIDYLNVRDVAATPTDTWYIGANSVYNTTGPNTASGFFLTQRASNAVIVLTSTSSTTWTVPSDWNDANNNIHLIGGGGGGAGSRVSGNNRAGGGGGGGGGYTKLTNQTLTKGASITYQCGAAGTAGAAGADGGDGGTTSWNSGASTAGGGGKGQATITPTSTGGAAGTGTTFNGGTGGAGSTSTLASTGNSGGGGAGAGGPNGVGGNGGNGFGSTTATDIAGGGGGGNGGGTNGGNASAATGGTGGNNSLGTGGGASNTSGTNGGGGGGSVSAASIGGYGIDVFGVGSGGGAGGEDDSNPTNTGGLYGGGGGGGGLTTAGTTISGSAGAQGAIIITYVPSTAVATTGNMFMLFQ